ncbi:MAG: hypothetical protein AAFS10_22470 [Myxococcota bacterium]
MRYTIDERVRYDQSALWQLHDAFYDHQGLAAWRSIPYMATSNYAAAHQHAQMLITLAEQHSSDTDPIGVLEVGSGAGRFAGNLLRALRNDCGTAGKRLAGRLRYLLSDFAPKVVGDAIAQPWLAPHVARGAVVPTLMDLDRPGSLQTLEGKPITMPMVAVIANYVACVCRTRQFRYNQGQWEELHISLHLDVEPWLCRTLSRERALDLCNQQLGNPEFFTMLHVDTTWVPEEGSLPRP